MLFINPQSGMGDLRIYSEFRIFFFFYFRGKKPEPGKLNIFYRGKKCGMIRHYCRSATHPDLTGISPISRFFSTHLEVFRFPDSTCENPRFLFCFEIGKTKRRLTLSHVHGCLQALKAWAKNKFCDRLN